MGRRVVVALIAALAGLGAFGSGKALADPESCAKFRQDIINMEKASVRPDGWVGLDLYLRALYAHECVLQPKRKPAQQYWFRADGTPLGIPAESARPEEGAYATTPEIAAACRNVPQLTPGMCALMKEVEADCRQPVDSLGRTQCAALLNGRAPELPEPTDPLPPLDALLGPPQPGVPASSNAALGADPGFQRMCGEAQRNFNTCTVRRENMSSIGTTQQGGTGQAGAFYECQKLYDGVLQMCRAVTGQRLPRMAIRAPSAATPPSKPVPTTGASAAPPPRKAAIPPPNERVDCGNGNYCPAGNACLENGLCAPMIGMSQVPGAVPISGGKFCPPGEHESRLDPGLCVDDNHIDCGGGATCPIGYRCGPNATCLGPRGSGPICSYGSLPCQDSRFTCSRKGLCVGPDSHECRGGQICGKISECTASGGCALVAGTRTPQIPVSAGNR